MEKGNKVEIINTGDIWEGKHGTVIAEEDGQVEVRVNFETQNGTEQVIEIFNKENLKMEREDESLNEAKTWKWKALDRNDKELIWDIVAHLDKIKKYEANDDLFVLIAQSLNWGKPKEYYKAIEDAELKNRFKNIIYKYGLADENNKIVDSKEAIDKMLDESLNEQKEELEESLNYEKTDDIIHPYVYLQDLDDKEIPAWNFASRIATAENVEEGFILKCAEDHKYKIFSVEAPSFFRTIIAAKEIKLEEIQEEYADFLQGNAVIYEMK